MTETTTLYAPVDDRYGTDPGPHTFAAFVETGREFGKTVILRDGRLYDDDGLLAIETTQETQAVPQWAIEAANALFDSRFVDVRESTSWYDREDVAAIIARYAPMPEPELVFDPVRECEVHFQAIIAAKDAEIARLRGALANLLDAFGDYEYQSAQSDPTNPASEMMAQRCAEASKALSGA